MDGLSDADEVRYPADTIRLDAKANERLAIARELHDTLLQGVQGPILSVQAVSERSESSETRVRLHQIADRADEVLAEGRENIRRLRFERDQIRSLVVEVERVVESMSLDSSATIRTVVEEKERDLVPLVREEMLQSSEGIHNAVKHANAETIEVKICFGSKKFWIAIRDDGKGLPPEVSSTSPAGHWGIRGIRERAASIGASVVFKKTDPNRAPPATTLLLELPSSAAHVR